MDSLWQLKNFMFSKSNFSILQRAMDKAEYGHDLTFFSATGLIKIGTNILPTGPVVIKDVKVGTKEDQGLTKMVKLQQLYLKPLLYCYKNKFLLMKIFLSNICVPSLLYEALHYDVFLKKLSNDSLKWW